MRHLLDGVREIQSSFHYAKKLLIKTSFSLLTIVLQGIGLLWPLILKRPPLIVTETKACFWQFDQRNPSLSFQFFLGRELSLKEPIL